MQRRTFLQAGVGSMIAGLGARPAWSAALTAAADTRALVETAVDAARWIDAATVRSERGLVWPADPNDPKSIATNLYSGSAGVVLFYLELHQATKRPEYLATARAGADYLLAGLKEEKETGLYTGIAGLGFAIAEVARATNDATYRDGVTQVVDLLSARAIKKDDGVEWSETTDVIGGGAGIGLFLLYAANAFKIASARTLAAQAGKRLIALGRPVSDGAKGAASAGTKWAMTPTFPRLMPNFSHGTAGIAYFLASLHRDTRRPEFLTAAIGGAHYLQSIAKTEGDVCLIFHHEPNGEDLHYLSWCHGPAGTARLFYRLSELTGDREWMTWVRRGARGIMTSGIPDRETPGFWNNVSPCCGSAGVAEFFLDLHRATGEAEYLAFARRMSDQVLRKATRDARGVHWIQAENRVSPEKVVAQTGYMQGAAGMGTLLLRLDAVERKRSTAFRLPDCPFPA